MVEVLVWARWSQRLSLRHFLLYGERKLKGLKTRFLLGLGFNKFIRSINSPLRLVDRTACDSLKLETLSHLSELRRSEALISGCGEFRFYFLGINCGSINHIFGSGSVWCCVCFCRDFDLRVCCWFFVNFDVVCIFDEVDGLYEPNILCDVYDYECD